MRSLPEPMDGEAARPPRSTDDTTRIPVMDDDAIGRHEAASAPRLAGQGYTRGAATVEPGWCDRTRAYMAARDAEWPGGLMWSAQDESNKKAATPHYPRHQAAKDDLPGPTRRELARLVRQVRALVIVLLVLFAGLHAYALYELIIG